MKDDLVFIRHMLDEIHYLQTESQGLTFENFESDETLKRAFARSLEIIGEAAKNLSDEFKTRHFTIKWKEIAGLRDKLIHHYFGVNWKRVWDVVKNRIPELKEQIDEILILGSG